MKTKLSYVVVALTSLVLLSLSPTLPVQAFIYPDGTVDPRYEYYGPHADYIQFNMFTDENAMFQALNLGQIDLTDWPLTNPWRTQAPPNGFAGNPDVLMVSSGGEAGFHTIDFNNNPHPYLGNPPNPTRPNPVYTVIPGYSQSKDGVPGIPPISNNVYFRLGVAHLFNRAAFNAFLGPAGNPILTPVPADMAFWIWPGAPGFPFNLTKAEEYFQLGHILQDTSVTPWVRYYDYNQNGARDAGEAEAAVLKMTWRTDTYSAFAGGLLSGELAAAGFVFDVAGTGARTGGQNYVQVMLNKDYHITTLHWADVGPDPDHLYDLYHISNYWDDPESGCPNTAALNDTLLNGFAEGVKFAPNSTVALTNAISFQQRFYAICAQIPLFSANAFKAHRKWYSGGNAETLTSPDDGENIFRRTGTGAKREWLGLANQQGLGDNGWWSLLNMWPNCSIYPPEYPGLGHMTIRYGWKEQQYPQHINPFYSEDYWDSIVLGSTYDTLGYRDPYSLTQWKPDLIKTWSAGTWNDAGTTKSKCTITLRPDVRFHDGTLMTIADVIFSLVESGQALLAMGYAPPWWWPTGELVRSYSIIDPYTVEILYDVQGFLVESWTLGGFYIVPKHIWKPTIDSGNPSAFCPDPNVIGSGPWRYQSLVWSSSLVMVANKPGVAVQTDQPGSSLITSPGPHYWDPVHVNIHLKPPYEYDTKVNIPHTPGVWPSPVETDVGVLVTLTSQYLDPRFLGSIPVPLQVNKYVYVDGVLQAGYPVLVSLSGGVPDEEQILVHLAKGNHTIRVAVHIKGPAEIEPGKANPWISHWVNATQIVWVTIAEDISGKYLHDYLGYSSYPYKAMVPAPDGKVDVQDIGRCAKAYGSFPGHPKWDSVADVNRDYRVDMDDLNLIAVMFAGKQDVAVQNISVLKKIVCQSCNAKFNVTIQNQANLQQNVTLHIKFDADDIKIESVSVPAGTSRIVTFDIIPRAFLFEEVSRIPGGVPIGNIGSIHLIGNGTYLDAFAGSVVCGWMSLPGGIIELRYSNGTLITREELLVPQDIHGTAFTAGTYGDGIYALGTNDGSLCILNDKGEFGEMSISEAPVNSLSVSGALIYAYSTTEDIVFRRYYMNFDIPIGPHVISVHADAVVAEYDTADNDMTDGSITVSILVDITGGLDGGPDGACDMKDISKIAKLFGVEYPNTKYNHDCDVIYDFAIDMKDISTAAKHFGEEAP